MGTVPAEVLAALAAHGYAPGDDTAQLPREKRIAITAILQSRGLAAPPATSKPRRKAASEPQE